MNCKLVPQCLTEDSGRVSAWKSANRCIAVQTQQQQQQQQQQATASTLVLMRVMSRQTERPMRGRLVERKTGAGNERKKNEEKYKQRVDE